LALVRQTKRSKRQGSKEGGKKDLSKVKCFPCHKTRHNASQCSEKMQQVATTVETQMDKFSMKFEDFSLVSYLSTSTITRSALYLDNGASHHITEARKLLSSLTIKYSGSHVELGDDVEYTVEGEGTILFQLESRGSLEAQDVIYVLDLKKNLLSISSLEDGGYEVLFKKGQALIHSEGAIPDTTVTISVKEGKIYRLQGMHVHGSKEILDHGSMSVAEDKEQEASKGEHSSQNSSLGSQPSGGKEELAPSNSVRRPSWYYYPHFVDN
jgi:hypothetical protein